MNIIRDAPDEELRRIYHICICSPSEGRGKVFEMTGINPSRPIYPSTDLIFENIVIAQGTKCFYDWDGSQIIIACENLEDHKYEFQRYHYIITDVKFLLDHFEGPVPF